MIMKGQKISDRYQIIKSIGEGGMANVYLAYDVILDRNVAVKVLRGDLATDEKFVRRFRREALAASSLSNPNIVEVYDVGEDNGEYYIVMEYIEGKHLKQMLRKRGKLTVSEVVDIALQITNGLSVAHDSYIIHRDIKPQNILMLDNGLVKITDFGIAVALNSTQLTQTNSVMGSVHYLPPEQASGEKATLQSDIYSIGVMMYELLTGKLPFKGDNAVEIALKHLKEPMPSVREEISTVPQALENIIIRATAKNPKNRYTDAREMHEDLKTCLDESREHEAKIVLKYPETGFTDKSLKVPEDKLETDEDPKEKKKKEKEAKKAEKAAEKAEKASKKPIKEKKKSKKEIEEAEELRIEELTNTLTEEDQKLIAKRLFRNENKKQNKILVVLLSIFTTIVVLITTIVVLIPRINASKQAYIPDVTNKTVSEAIKLLQDSGFMVSDKQINQASSKVEEDHVIKTNPAAGLKRKKGYEVTLYVSTGSSQIEVIDYTGKNYNEVKGNLEAKGIVVTYTYVELAKDKKAEEGTIVGQSKDPGTYLEAGDTIKFELPKVINKYPDFTKGFSVDDIKEWCYQNDVPSDKLQIIYATEVQEEYEEGAIYKQNVIEGTTVNPALTIKIYINLVNDVTGDVDPDVNADDVPAEDENDF